MPQNPVSDITDPPPGSASRLFRSLQSAFRRTRGRDLETDLEGYRRRLAAIRARDAGSLSNDEILVRAAGLSGKAQGGAPQEDLAVEVFALVREAARRALSLEPFDVQLVAGLAMARGRVAELPTGEGKTLAAVFPASLLALYGRGVHILTFNDYLARRDAAWMGPVYRRLGLRVGCVQEGRPAEEKRAAYEADVTYATAKEAGFDFLRDRIAVSPADRVHRPFQAALVDEADSILIDEARIPLVISGAEERAAGDAARMARLARGLVPGVDYETDNERRNVFLTERGAAAAEADLGRGSLYAPENQGLLESLYCALHAAALLRRDVDYIVRAGRIEIVDEFTGRVVDRRLWPDGLQAAVEAREGLAARSEARVLGQITLRHFFGLYPRLAGMTATARASADELKEFCGLGVTVVPPHVPSVREDLPDLVFSKREEKLRALVADIAAARASGRPVLVGTANVRESEELGASLGAAGVAHRVLNAKNDELEAGIIAEAGRPGAVTISTNMAGRGTDIRLGGGDAAERGRALALGGLLVIGTNRHESRRVDDQLKGRAGRQGDPGTTRFYISLEDPLFERHDLREPFEKRHGFTAEAGVLRGRAVGRDVDHAQRVIEGMNFDVRRALDKYSSLIELQRRIVEERREPVVYGGSPGLWAARFPALHAQGVERLGAERMAALERRAFLARLDRGWADHLAWVADARESIHLVGLGGRTPVLEFQKDATASFMEMTKEVERAALEDLRRIVEDGEEAVSRIERRRGPSSTWTTLVSDDQLGWGIEMAMGRNLGLAMGSAVFLGPLYVLTLLLKRRRPKRPSA